MATVLGRRRFDVARSDHRALTRASKVQSAEGHRLEGRAGDGRSGIGHFAVDRS